MWLLNLASHAIFRLKFKPFKDSGYYSEQLILLSGYRENQRVNSRTDKWEWKGPFPTMTFMHQKLFLYFHNYRCFLTKSGSIAKHWTQNTSPERTGMHNPVIDKLWVSRATTSKSFPRVACLLFTSVLSIFTNTGGVKGEAHLLWQEHTTKLLYEYWVMFQSMIERDSYLAAPCTLYSSHFIHITVCLKQK